MKKALILLAVSLAFLGASIGMFFGGALPGLQDRQTRTNESIPITIATITHIERASSGFYRIHFEWTETTGNLTGGPTHTGRTPFLLNQMRAQNMLQEGTIEIRVAHNRGVAVNVLPATEMYGFFVGVAIFGLIALITGIVALVLLYFEIRVSRTLKFGMECKGGFLRYKPTLMTQSNPARANPRFNVQVMFKDKKGRERIRRSWVRFSWDETTALEDMGWFPIKISGRFVVIPKEPIHEFRRINPQKTNFADFVASKGRKR